MGWFPFFIQLEGARGLLVGGGRVALRKAEKLLPFGAQLTVVAPCICPPLAALPGLTLCRRAFADSDLSPAPDFVIAATGDRALDRRIAALCRARRILVNVVDDPAACGFYFPALVQRGRLCIGISTGGASPTAAAWLRQKIEALLPPGFDGILDRLAARREAVKAEGGSEAKRAERLQQAFALELAAAEAPHAPAAARENAGPGRVALVGAGCGRADLITVRGLRLLQQCRAVVYDDLIDTALLDTVPAGAERIYVGKRSGRHSAPQAEINAALIALAQRGGLTVRLKGGDPYVFGRGGEEALALQRAGIPFEVVPGITAAIAVPAEAGIPVTHRGVSRAVHIITAHTQDETPDFSRWAALAADGTLVFLMGLQRLPQIAAGLLAGGLPPAPPGCAFGRQRAAPGRCARKPWRDHRRRARGRRRSPGRHRRGRRCGDGAAEFPVIKQQEKPLAGGKVPLSAALFFYTVTAAAGRFLYCRGCGSAALRPGAGRSRSGSPGRYRRYTGGSRRG